MKLVLKKSITMYSAHHNYHTLPLYSAHHNNHTLLLYSDHHKHHILPVKCPSQPPHSTSV